MNRRLSFSWGHILALVALIVVMYLSYVGLIYLTDGSQTLSIIGMVLTALVYVIFFIGGQQLKASGRNIRQSLLWERVLIFLTPLVFIAGLWVWAHSFTVARHSEEIMTAFNEALTESKQLFPDYEEYANARMSRYEHSLDTVIAQKTTNPALYQRAGFREEDPAVERANMLHTLQLKLLSKNYTNLRDQAVAWIESANKGTSTWNVFMVGNTQAIVDAIKDWHKQLTLFASGSLTNEPPELASQAFVSPGAEKAVKNLSQLKQLYTKTEVPTAGVIAIGVLLYVMLLFPWLIQARNTKSPFHLMRGRTEVNYDGSTEKDGSEEYSGGGFTLDD